MGFIILGQNYVSNSGSAWFWFVNQQDSLTNMFTDVEDISRKEASKDRTGKSVVN